VTRQSESLNWHDFLGRPPLTSLTSAEVRTLTRNPILITGAGGSIGSALATRLARVEGARLVLLQSSESHLSALEKSLGEIGAGCELTSILGSAGDSALLEHIFAVHAPRLVFHTAAFKQVPLLETQPFAASENNVFSTETLARICARHAACFVLLSTDKAAAPTSMLGVSKRLAELTVLAHDGRAVRFGNVLGSRDSVTEIFARQARQGGPLTVTHPAAQRYFITIDDAVHLLLSVAAEPAPGLFVPALEREYLVADLARFIAARIAPGVAIPIEFSSLRAGDKMSESLWSADESASATDRAGLLRIATPLPLSAHLTEAFAALHAACDTRDLASLLDAVRALIPSYAPSAAVLASQPIARVAP
jgi:FlaA1/EpsC-like NDP-sugar epimerase